MFLDIALGLLVAHVVTFFSTIELYWWHAVLGIVFTLLPDTDAVYHYAKTKEVAAYADSPEDHRDGLHYPLLYITIGTILTTIIALVSVQPEIIFLFIGGTILHFLHDSVGTGWGIKWLWPLNNKSYKFFCEKDGAWSTNLIVSWNPSELENAIVKYGDKDWIQNLFVYPLVRLCTLQGLPSLGVSLLLVGELLLPLIIIVCILL